MFLALDGFLFNWGGGSSSATAGAGYHLLLALWSDQWVPGSGSASATASLSLSLSFSHSHSHDDGGGHGHGGHGGHGGAGHHKWFDHGHYRMADDEYWTAREAMFKRHIPLEPHLPAEKPVEVVELVRKHDRLIRHADEIFNLPDLSELSRELDRLSTQILDIELQSDDEAILALLLC